MNSKWVAVRVELLNASLRIIGAEETTTIVFESATRVTIPMRNLRTESRFKGCAFQIESPGQLHVFMASSLPEKNKWARKLNIVLGELRKSGKFEKGEENDENFALTPLGVNDKLVPVSVDRQQRQKAAVQQLALSLQPQKKSQSRIPSQTTELTVDRSAEIKLLEKAIEARTEELIDREHELQNARDQLHREQQYREQITSGVEKWRKDLGTQKDQKLADTRERLEEESSRVRVLEKEKNAWEQSKDESVRVHSERIAELEAHVAELESQTDEGKGLRKEISFLRERLEKEIAFIHVLEHDTQQMAAELMSLASQHAELKERSERDGARGREERDQLCQQLRDKESETLELKREVGVLKQDNIRLQDAQNNMHREFFFSLALSIKLSLAQQGIYSNADLNQLYESVLSEPYANWTGAIERQLVLSQMSVEKPVSTPVRRPQQQQQQQHTPASSRKRFLGGFFGN